MPAPEPPPEPVPAAAAVPPRAKRAAAPAKKRRPLSARAAVRRERLRVAEVLHNTICQELTGIGLMASAAARRLPVDQGEVDQALREVSALVQRAGRGLQEFVRTLRP